MVPPVGVCKMANRSKELFQRICADMVLPNMIILGAAISACGVDALENPKSPTDHLKSPGTSDCFLKTP